MAQLILTQSSQFHRALRLGNGIPLSLRVGKFFLFFSMTLMIGIISFFYLLKFTELQTKGYQLKKLELEHNSLIDARETKTTQIAELKSLTAIREGAVGMSMVVAKAPVFIQKDGSIALQP